MLPREKIDDLVARLHQIDDRLTQQIDRETRVKLGRERADLEPIHNAVGELRAAEKERSDLAPLLDDPEMKDIAANEAAELDERIGSLEATIRRLLLPKDAADEKSAILEIRAGTGGS